MLMNGINAPGLYYIVYAAEFYSGEVSIITNGETICNAVCRLSGGFFITAENIFRDGTFVPPEGCVEHRMSVEEAKKYLKKNKVTIDKDTRVMLKRKVRNTGYIFDAVINGIAYKLCYWGGYKANSFIFKVVNGTELLSMLHIGSKNTQFVKGLGTLEVNMQK